MIILDCPQMSDQWFEARLGIVTASKFSMLVTSKGSASTTHDKLKDLKFDEWVSQKRTKTFTSADMQYGIDTEPQARAWYAFARNVDVKEVGLAYLDGSKMVAVSPDGFVIEEGYEPPYPFSGVTDWSGKGLLEIKCPLPHTHRDYLKTRALPTVYKAQVQGQMWVTGAAWCDFLSFRPDMEPMILRIDRDEAFINSMSTIVKAFAKDLTDECQQFNKSLGRTK